MLYPHYVVRKRGERRRRITRNEKPPPVSLSFFFSQLLIQVSCLELIYVQGREEKPAAQPAKTEYRILKKKIMITFDQKKKKEEEESLYNNHERQK